MWLQQDSLTLLLSLNNSGRLPVSDRRWRPTPPEYSVDPAVECFPQLNWHSIPEAKTQRQASQEKGQPENPWFVDLNLLSHICKCFVSLLYHYCTQCKFVYIRIFLVVISLGMSFKLIFVSVEIRVLARIKLFIYFGLILMNFSISGFLIFKGVFNTISNQSSNRNMPKKESSNPFMGQPRWTGFFIEFKLVICLLKFDGVLKTMRIGVSFLSSKMDKRDFWEKLGNIRKEIMRKRVRFGIKHIKSSFLSDFFTQNWRKIKNKNWR